MDEEQIRALLEALAEKISSTVNGTTEELTESMIKSIGKIQKEQSKKKPAGADDIFGQLEDEINDASDAFYDSTEAMQQVADDIYGVSKGFMNLATESGKLMKSFATTVDSLEPFKGLIEPVQQIIESSFNLLGDAVGGVLGGLGGLVSVIPLVGESFGGLISGLGDIIGGLSKMAGKLLSGAFGVVANMMLDALTTVVGMLSTTTDVGLIFSDGIVGITRNLSKMSLTADEFTSVIKNNTDDLLLLGGTMAEGLQRASSVIELFNPDTKAMKKGEKSLRDRMYNMGISYQDQSEGLVDFMAQLSRTGQLNEMSNMAIRDASFEYMVNLKTISTLTGKTAAEMKKERDEAMQNLAWRQKLASVDEEERIKLTQSLNLVPEANKQAFKEAVIFGKVMTDVGAISTGFNTHIEAMALSAQTVGTTMSDVTTQFVNNVKTDAPRLNKAISEFNALGYASMLGNATGLMTDMQSSMIGQLDFIKQARNLDPKAILESSLGAKGLESVFEVQRKAYTGIMDLLVSESETLTTVMGSLSEKFSAFLTDAFGAYKTGGLDGLTDHIGKVFSSFFGSGDTPGGAGLMNNIMGSIDEALNITSFIDTVQKSWLGAIDTFHTAAEEFRRLIASFQTGYDNITGGFLGWAFGSTSTEQLVNGQSQVTKPWVAPPTDRTASFGGQKADEMLSDISSKPPKTATETRVMIEKNLKKEASTASPTTHKPLTQEIVDGMNESLLKWKIEEGAKTEKGQQMLLDALEKINVGIKQQTEATNAGNAELKLSNEIAG